MAAIINTNISSLTAQRNQGIETLAGSEFLQHQRDLERTCHGAKPDIAGCHAENLEFGKTGIAQAFANRGIEPAHHDTDLHAGPVKVRRNCFHFHLFSFTFKPLSLQIFESAWGKEHLQRNPALP